MVTRNGAVEKTIPVSMGKKGHETPNGTYYVTEKFPMIIMDSSTYGVPVDSPDRYRLKVYDAARISNTGIFVHSDSAKWFMATFNRGDLVVVKNSVGAYNQNEEPTIGSGKCQFHQRRRRALRYRGVAEGQ